MLMKATSNDEKATQGYVLREISGTSQFCFYIFSHCLSKRFFYLYTIIQNSPTLYVSLFNRYFQSFSTALSIVVEFLVCKTREKFTSDKVQGLFFKKS